MGASVGNTFIAWIMAAEFNFSISNYIYPLILVAFYNDLLPQMECVGKLYLRPMLPSC